MMKYLVLVTCLAAGLVKAYGQQNYSVDLIPKELMPYASTVVRDDETYITVEDLDNTIERRKLAITVLNENGDDDASLQLDYDKGTVIKYVKGAIYNGFGKQTGKFSESDFADRSAWDGFSLFLGDRIKYYRNAVTEYPYTIVYEYEKRLKQSLDFPQFEPVPGFGVAVEKASFTFSCRPDFPVRYKENNINGGANIGISRNGAKTYSWQVANLKATRYEPYSPYYKKVIPSVHISPQEFTYYGVGGSYTDWKSLGKWIYDKLLADRGALPQETIDHVRGLTKDITDPKLKAKAIYEYMQRKTHYVSVQVGIGGFQPFLASDVDKQNYGDCKALVNYTQALLKAVNIDSYYCIVESGRRYKVSLNPDFASMDQGNHIILCVPFKNDNTWADCTSQSIPFGYLGDFTDDRTVLACTPEGGRLLRTPKYTTENDLESRKMNFVIGTDGAISGTMNTLFKGTDYDDRENFVNETGIELNKMIQKVYPINNMEIDHYNIKQDKTFDPATNEYIKLHARDYASLTDGKYYFMLNPVNRVDEPPKQVTNRQNDVYFNLGFTELDDVTYTIPAGYHLEKTPLKISIDKPFAKFSAVMELKGNQLTYKRKFRVIDGTYNKEIYEDVVDFYQDVVDADQYMVSLAKD